jgi:hypothetical protein
MDSEPASMETPVCTETVLIPASANTHPMSQPAADEMQHQLPGMDSKPASKETPFCTETVPIPASANTSPMSHPAADENTAEEVAYAEDGWDEENISTYSPPSVRLSRSKLHVLA